MSRTPNTPFIPPLPTSPDSSPPGGHPPVIPTSTPNWNQPVATGGGYAPFASPYSAHSPFIPNLSPMVAPGVIPGMFSPQQQPKVNRFGFSEDFTGYPPGSGGVPPMLSSPNQQAYYSPYSNHSGSHPNSPHYPQSAPAGYQGFGTPWNANPAQLPSTPWGGFGSFGNYGPPPPLTGPPPQAMGGPPQPRMGNNIPPPQNMQQPQMGNMPPPQMNGQGNPWQGGAPAPYPPFYGQDPGPWGGGGGQQHFGQQQHQPPFRAPPEPPSQIFDRMDPFTEGRSYGDVLDPFLTRVVRADVRLNPLISPLPDDGSDRIHLNWNMLFPTSTVQRSNDPSHVSWSKGRDAPATFPRISSLRLVSDTIPFVLSVEARDIGVGVTCGEVIDSIGNQLVKFSDKRDYERLAPSLRQEVGMAYRRNRSREPGVPGGQLGQGMKRLDFLRLDTMFAGIEVNDRIVKRVCGDVLPCVFVLKCAKIFPLTRQEVEDREARLRSNSRPRSRASSGGRINVQPPSTADSDDDDDLHS